MAVTLLGTPGLPWTDSNGDPLNGGLINAYEPGTTTRRNTYPTRSDADAGSNANTNPVVLSSTGIAEIWLDSRYKIIVTDSGGTTIDTIDEVGTLTGADVFDRDHIAGMLVSLDADAAHDINVTSGECRDSADSFDISRAAEYTKKIDAAWAAGDDAGGLAEHAVAVVANNTIYYIWSIAKSGDNTSDFLISTSNSAPTMPTDYDKKRLIGVTKTDGSANLERVSNIERTGFSAVWPDSGSADAYVITPLPALTAYASGARFSFIAENACTGATTINVSALGTKAIQLRGSALTGIEIGAAKLVTVEYSAGAFQIVSGSPAAVSSATVAGVVELATVAEVLTGTDTSRAVTAAGVFGPRDEHRSVTNSITAGSTQTQAGATAMTTGYNRVTASGTDGDGVKLPTAAEGLIVHVVNDDSAQTIKIWPATSDAVDGGSANAVDANVLGFGESRTYFAVDATNWYTVNDMPAATATVPGKVELATTAETATGTDSGRAVTPDGLHDMTTLSGAAWMLDEDDLSTDSAVKVPSQQSVKAYVDASVPATTAASRTVLDDATVAAMVTTMFGATTTGTGGAARAVSPTFTTPTLGAASATSINLGAEVLSVYDEGLATDAFTPGIAFGGGTTGIAYSTQTGFYLKIGKMCWVDVRVTISNKGSSSGALTFTGLPFTSANVSGENVGSIKANFIENVNLDTSVTEFGFGVTGNATTMNCWAFGDDVAGQNMDDGDCAANSNWQLAGWYPTA
jgi:hypothetical protein